MIQPKQTALFYAPKQVPVVAEIVTLTPALVAGRIARGWWDEECLKERFDDPPPIDLYWDWNEVAIEFEGSELTSEKIAIVAGDDGAVQGASLVSSSPVPSVLDAGGSGLFVELLFTAPRNRRALRRDGADYLKGVGAELLTWAAWFSRESGFDGRLRLDGSPDHLKWYENRGLQRLDVEPILFEGVIYTPMELSPSAAMRLLEAWA